MRGARPAFTLADSIVAAVVFVLAVAPVLTLVLGYSRPPERGYEHARALALAHRLAEGLRVAGWENPHATDASAASQGPPFRCTVTSAPRTLATTGDLLDISVTVEWSDRQHEEREVVLALALPRHRGLAVPPPQARDRARLDAEVVAALWPALTGRALDRTVPRERIEKVRALGDAVVLTRALLGGEADPATPRSPLARARAREARAALALDTLVYLAPRLALARSLEPADFAGGPPDRARYETAVQELPAIERTFATELAAARAAYLEIGGLPPRVAARALVKAIELAKLEALTCGPTDLAPLHALLARLEAAQATRNPDIAAFARAERRLASSLDALRAGYRAPAWVDGYRAFVMHVEPARARILSMK